MKKYFTMALSGLVFLMASSCFADTLATQNGSKREVASFNAVDIKGLNTTTITVGQAQSITLSGAPASIGALITEVKDNTLLIYYPDSYSAPLGTKGINIAITVPSLQTLRISGDSLTTVSQIKNQSFAVEAKGNASITLSGSTDNLNLDLKGSTQVNAKDLLAKKVMIDAKGAAAAQVYASSELHTDAKGNVIIKAFGNPAVVTNNVKGNVQVDTKN